MLIFLVQNDSINIKCTEKIGDGAFRLKFSTKIRRNQVQLDHTFPYKKTHNKVYFTKIQEFPSLFCFACLFFEHKKNKKKTRND